MGKKLSKAPVCITLAQIQFEPPQDWSGAVAELREQYLQQGYPEHEAIEETVVDFQGGPDGIKTTQRTISRHWFSNQVRTQGLMLDPSSLTLHTTDYPIFAKYAAAFGEAIEVIARTGSIEHVERIGIRMLDAIQPGEQDTLDDYVIPATRAFGDALGLDEAPAESSSEVIFRREQRTLIVRTHRNDRGLAIPSDLNLLGSRLHIAQRFLDGGRPTLMLDTDAFTVERLPFEIPRIRDELARLKQMLSRCFKAVATPYAMEKWK